VCTVRTANPNDKVGEDDRKRDDGDSCGALIDRDAVVQ
jgi:hypothetical protein